MTLPPPSAPTMMAKDKARFRKALFRGLLVAASVFLVLIVAVALIMWTGLSDRWARSAIISQLERITGGVVELREFRFHAFTLRAELNDLTIHGREPLGTSPLFHADYMLVDVRVDSFFHHKFSLHEVRVDRPAVHIRVEADGSSNVPSPKTKRTGGRPWRERIFEIAIRKVRLNDGYLIYNDVRVPLVAEGGQFNFALDYNATLSKRFYIGQLTWQQMILAARRYIPFPSDITLRFTLERDAFSLDQLMWRFPQSEIDAQASLASFTNPAWSFRYRARLILDDIRTIMRKPSAPTGRVDFTGEGQYAAKQFKLHGRYAAHDIALRFVWFHTTGIESRGSYRADKAQLEVPDFEAHALGGIANGRVMLVFKGQKFQANTRERGMSLATILAAIDHKGFPIASLHWNAAVDADSVTTWLADFKHLDARGLSIWAPPTETRSGEIPVSARLPYHFNMDRNAVDLPPGEISTPSSHLEITGVLGSRDSGLDAKFDTQDLLPWNDFINHIRGLEAEPKRIAGRVSWRGRVEGPLSGPAFIGHVRGFQTSYGRLYWDQVEGDMTYSPDELRLVNARLHRGASSADLELMLELDEWSFRPESKWSLDAGLVRASTDELQDLFNWPYPAHGLLTGTFHGRGTRADPELSGLFDIAQVEAWGYRFDRVRGQLNVSRDEVRISNTEIRTLAAGAPPSRGPGIITGNLLYRMAEREIAIDLTGAGISLESIPRVQFTRLSLGGVLTFKLHAKGPLRELISEGTLRLVDLRVGKEVLGSFNGRLDADGRRVHLAVNSEMAKGRLEGKLDLNLRDDFPLRGDVTLEGMDLDPFILSAFHLRSLTGHSSVDGRFQISGAIMRPETIAVSADVSHLEFNYENVKLENVGPLRLNYRRDELRIEQAYLRGTDTDFRISGFARFAGDRRLGMNVAGTINLRLASGFVPDLEARGPAEINAAIEGTMSNPRITGKVHVANASANYGEFPAGLSQVTGDFVFNASRLLFENVTAQTGGGQLSLGGTLTYGEGPLRYEISLRTDRARIRYPEGMSWLAGGTLRLSGTKDSGLLSGRVQVERLFMAQGFDIASLVVASNEPATGPPTASAFLRNLQLDIEAVSGPGARIEWTAAQVESDATMRVRGTWAHPILLGHIHLLNGEISFHGNRYKLARGDIDFAIPFRFDPMLNVEATTTIRQYEVTLDFTGQASKMTLAYRSDPPLPATDIIGLLALGRTSEESHRVTSVQNPELGATTLLSEAISSQLGGRIERLFGISRFRVDPFLAGTGTEQNAAARVTIEQQVTRDLVITYITNVTSNQQQVIQVEYNVNKNLSIIALRDQNGTFGLDIKRKKRFK